MAITPAAGYQIDPNNPNGVVPIGAVPQSPTAQAPIPQTPPTNPAQNPVPPSGGTVVNVNQPAPAEPPKQPEPKTQPAGTPPSPLSMPATGSVVDLLNSAGTDSSFAARQQLAQQYGIQGYTGTAAQNQDLSKKFLDAFNANKETKVPDNSAQASSAIDQYLQQNQQQPQQDPSKAFIDTYASMNPIEANLFQQLSTLASTQTNQQSLRDLYTQEVAAQGIPALNLQLADMNRIMEGTEDDIRDEITNAGGFATDSQVQALTTARNKTLLTKAQYLSDLINAKNDYVDHIVNLTQADRKQVSDDLDRKLGITNTLVNMADKMQSNAKENYQSIVNNVGYDGLVSSISSQEDLKRVSQSLGLEPSTLLQLATVQTPAQKQMALQEANYQLSVDKFNEDKRQFGLQYALEKNKLANQQAAATVVSPYQLERSTRSIQSVDELLPKVTDFTVGVGSLLKNIPGSPARDFAAELDTLKANIIAGELTAMREASKTGGALGNVSDKESAFLSASLGALDIGQSPENFKEQLGKVKESIYRWNAQALSISKDFDYQGAKNADWSDEEIYNYLRQ